MTRPVARPDSWALHRAPRLAAGVQAEQLVALATVVVVLATWEVFASVRDVASFVLPPSAVSLAVWDFVTTGRLADQLGPSMRRVGLGFAIGSGLGVIGGLAAGVSRLVRNLVDHTQSFVHAIPKIALFPAIAVSLGFTDRARILVIATAAFFPAYLNAMNGALGINPRLVWVSRNAGANRRQTFLQVILPASLPRTLVGLRISLMVSFVLMVATEVIGFADGLGAGVMRSYYDADYHMMYAGIIIIAIAGFLANAVLQQFTKLLLRGRASGGGVAHG